ncbi:MAG: hypothetical protein JSR39_08985 [Verrucomicrobia bacterium]|nr:hypothetical protein [Verrucomicrobiota bacterium]
MDFKVLLSLSSVLTSLNPHLGSSTVSQQYIEAPSNATSSNKSLLRKVQAESQLLEFFVPSELMPHYIGELQEKWQFTSDHLPMGAKLDDFHIVTWNVLNSEYMGWVEMNTQGLKRSLIMLEHVYLDGTGLTVRDVHVIDQINQMIGHPTHPRSVLALQECSRSFIEALAASLPSSMKIIRSSESPQKDQNILIYDANLFNYVPEESAIVTDAFPSQSGRSLMDIMLVKKDSNEKFRFINAHVPGDPNLPGRFEMADYAVRTQQDDMVTVVLGDMNFDDMEMLEAFNRAYAGRENQFHNFAGYYSNIGIDKYAKCIDHLFVHFGSSKKTAEAEQPEDVLPELPQVVALLQKG